MRKTLYAFGAAASLLLFVGGGCAPRSTDSTAEVKTNEQADAAVVQGSVDATVDSIIIDTMTEQSAQRRMETEAEGMSSDQAEINAYGQADYDLK